MTSTVVVQMPWATVFEVQHCGFTVARRELTDESEWDWQLEAQQEGRGVAWMM